jgi:uncharacterized protein (TIGR02118 family)
MYKVIFLTRRKPGVTLEQYFEHYHGKHFELASNMPGLVSYRQMPIRREGPNNDAAPEEYDAVSEYIYESDEAALAAFASPEGQELNADTGEFIDWPSVITLPVSLAQERTR